VVLSALTSSGRQGHPRKERDDRQGPFVDQADVAFSFSSPVRIYGIRQESPSDLHHIECFGVGVTPKANVQLPDSTKQISSVQCLVRPILFQESRTNPFRVTIATDSSEVPRILAVAKNLELVQADQFSTKENAWRDYVFEGVFIGFAVMMFFDFLRTVIRRRRRGDPPVDSV